jgi:hypothetical protein
MAGPTAGAAAGGFRAGAASVRASFAKFHGGPGIPSPLTRRRRRPCEVRRDGARVQRRIGRAWNLLPAFEQKARVTAPAGWRFAMEMTADRQLHDTQLDRRLHDIGWGLLLMLTGAVWLFPDNAVPAGTWFLGVAAILLGLNAIRYMNHVPISGFSLALGIAACAAAVSQIWRTDLPLVAIFLLVIGASLVARPLLGRNA